jgi:hypothetical protein
MYTTRLMKKYAQYLLMLIGLGATATVCGQPTKQQLDSSVVWIPREDAKKVLEKALQADLLNEKITAKENDIKLLNERIAGLQEIIATMKSKDIDQKSLVESYEKQIKEMEEIRKLQELDVSVYKKQIRKLKRGKVWAAIGGTAATIGAFWLGTQL